MKKYEGMFIFPASTQDEALNAVIERSVAEMTNLGGVIESTDILGRKTFARPMAKQDSGIYVRVRFEFDPANIKPLLARYALDEEVFRFHAFLRNERLEAEVAADKVRRAKWQERVAAAEAAEAAAEAEAAGAEAPAAEAPAAEEPQA